MSARPEDGYRVRSRIGGRPGRSGRLVPSLAMILVGGWLAVTLASRQPTTELATPPAPTAAAVARTPAAPTPAAPTSMRPGLPDIESLEGAPRGAFPVVVGELGWLLLADASLLNAVDPAWTQFPFLLPSGGSICVCVEPGAPPAGPNLLHVVTYLSDGTEQLHAVIDTWSGGKAHDGFIVDAALTADGMAAVVAVAYVDGQVWSVGLDRIEMWDGQPRLDASVTVATVQASNVEDGAFRSVRVWLSPDGRLARVQTSGERDGLIAPGSRPTDSRIVSVAPETFGAEVAVVEAGSEEPGSCVEGGWATPVDFVTVCVDRELGVVEPALWIRRDSVDGSTARVAIGGADRLADAAWLIEARAGVVYGWSAATGELYRVEIPNLAVLGRKIELTPRELLTPEVEPPAPLPRNAAWQPMGFGPALSPFVGSPDGSLLYAAGYDLESPAIRPGTPPTTGIYVIDAERLRLVHHWPAEASYDALGISPNGEYLIASGIASPAEYERWRTEGSMLVLHETLGGAPLLILRRLEHHIGRAPTFLVPQPGPDVRFGTP